jgi:metal-dependent amidase/aminoacylase/carboxypeptidase family protein
LEMSEANHDLSYRSANPNAAHMCGHDGHTTVLAGLGVYLH